MERLDWRPREEVKADGVDVPLVARVLVIESERVIRDCLRTTYARLTQGRAHRHNLCGIQRP